MLCNSQTSQERDWVQSTTPARYADSYYIIEAGEGSWFWTKEGKFAFFNEYAAHFMDYDRDSAKFYIEFEKAIQAAAKEEFYDCNIVRVDEYHDADDERQVVKSIIIETMKEAA